MLNLIRDQGLIDRLSERSRWPKRASPYPAVLYAHRLTLLCGGGAYLVSRLQGLWGAKVSNKSHIVSGGFAIPARDPLYVGVELLCTLFLSKQSAPGVRWSCKVDVSSEIQQTRFIQKLSSRRDPFHMRFIQIFISPLEATSSQAEEQMSHAWDIPCESKSDLQYSKLSCRLVAIQLIMRFTWIS